MILAGRIGGAHGVRGWVKVYSYTDPLDNLLDYSPWHLSVDEQPLQKGAAVRSEEALEGRLHGKGLIVRLKGCDNRDQAEKLNGLFIQVEDSQLPELPPGDYYWKDLVGLQVVNHAGQLLGEVLQLMETGANDVLVVGPTEASEDDRQRMIPWLPGEVVSRVDLREARLTVTWELDY